MPSATMRSAARSAAASHGKDDADRPLRRLLLAARPGDERVEPRVRRQGQT